MIDGQDIDMLAAEYVLGTLDRDERSEVASRRASDPALAAAIEAWEARLGPMHDYVGEAQPSPAVFRRIEAELDAAQPPRTVAGSSEIIALRRRVSRWRGMAIGATAMAAAFAGLLVYTGALLPSSDQQFVAVFNQGDQQPSFVLSVDLATRQLTIRPITAEAQSDKSYELWIVSDKLPPGPQSLGLLDGTDQPTRKQVPQFDAELLQNATFGISVEPKGGSPVGKPTGPALHGRLIPAEG